MHRSLTTVIALVGLIGMPAVADDAQSILAKVREKQVERWAGVDRYAVDKSVLGNRATLVYERFDITTEDGRVLPAFRAAPVSAATADANAGVDTETMMTEYAKGMEMTGTAMDSEMQKGLEQAGLPSGLLKGMGAGADPWASPDPAAMMTGMAPVMRDMAGAEKRLDAEATQNATADVEGMAAFAEKARLVGTEAVDGRQAFHVRAEDMNQTQEVDGQTFVLDDASLWIDTQEYVPLRSKVEGVATSAGDSRPVVLESLNTDYRRVSGSTMYEPYKQVLRIAGLMSPEQQQEMREADQKLAEMDAQLAQMPEAQRQMVMNQMGPQLEMMRKMASGDALEMETVVHQIVINPDAAALQAMQGQSLAIAGQRLPMPTGAAAMAGASATSGAAAPPGAPESDLKRAQQACLAQKVKEAEEAQKKKRGLGRLMSAVGRVASKYGGADVSQTMGEVYSANATAEDLAAAAKDLGLTEEDVAACQNPP